MFASLIQIGVTVLFVSNLSKDYDPKGEVERAMRKKAEDEFILLINDEEHNKAQTLDFLQITYQTQANSLNLGLFWVPSLLFEALVQFIG